MQINENKFTVLAEQKPGQVIFSNYEELRNLLTIGLQNYKTVVYSSDQIDLAKSDLKTLKAVKKKITDKRKELEEAYTAPYQDVKAKLEELVAIIDEPLKVIDTFIKSEELSAKRADIASYIEKKSSVLGEFASKITGSPAFLNPKWDNITFKPKQWQTEIDEKIEKAVSDLRTIQESGSKHTPALLARYFETLSLDGAKDFIDAIESDFDTDAIEEETNNQVVGYKILKITATDGQMASLLKQMEIMGLDVEEIEDGMPKTMEELTEPFFDSFVAFDIETTGTYGAANGDREAGITEIGAVRVVNGKIVERFDELANPGREIIPRIARITHITNEMIADKPPIDEIIKKFQEFCGDSILIGHNIKSSDLHYILRAANSAGIALENRYLDTYILAKRFKTPQKWEKLNLGYLAGQYGFKHTEAHRAWNDAEVNAQLYFELKKLCGV